MEEKIRAVLDGIKNEVGCWCHTVMGPEYYVDAYGEHSDGCKAAQTLYDEMAHKVGNPSTEQSAKRQE